jgi:hypothetical protein
MTLPFLIQTPLRGGYSMFILARIPAAGKIFGIATPLLQDDNEGRKTLCSG